ncbi:MAG: hypothetical protein ACREB2_14235, partial [Pseudolabrys sp.]
LGAITYRARGRPKVVQFWRMKAAAKPSRDIMNDIVAVEWLPLAAAVRRLSYPLERLFLRHVGRRILRRRRKRGVRRKRRAHSAKSRARRRSKRKPHVRGPIAAHARKLYDPAHRLAASRSEPRTMLERMLGRIGG